MTVTKRTRFEVLRRDNHTCRYCRSTENPLTIDHVVPTSLGGTDDPGNLVAACKDCNSGKSSAAPDAEMVAQVSDEALRHADRIRQAYAVVVQRMGDRDEYIDEFAEEYTYTPLPDDWRNSVGRWFEMGVPIELVVDAARIACSKTQRFPGHSRFSYMCGIIWNQVHVVNEAVELRAALDGAFMSDSELFDERLSWYEKGQQEAETAGYKHGIKTAEQWWRASDDHSRFLAHAVEGSWGKFITSYESHIAGHLAELRRVEPLEEVA